MKYWEVDILKAGCVRGAVSFQRTIKGDKILFHLSVVIRRKSREVFINYSCQVQNGAPKKIEEKTWSHWCRSLQKSQFGSSHIYDLNIRQLIHNDTMSWKCKISLNRQTGNDIQCFSFFLLRRFTLNYRPLLGGTILLQFPLCCPLGYIGNWPEQPCFVAYKIQ